MHSRDRLRLRQEFIGQTRDGVLKLVRLQVRMHGAGGGALGARAGHAGADSEAEADLAAPLHGWAPVHVWGNWAPSHKIIANFQH